MVFKKNSPGCCPCAGGATVALPGCLCAATPTTLTMTSTNHVADGAMFQDDTIHYIPVPAGYAALSLGTNAFISDNSFVDSSFGDTFQYYFRCNSTIYELTRIFLTSIFGTPYMESARYTWVIGSAGNTCTPAFLLSSGTIFSGGNPTTVVAISG